MPRDRPETTPVLRVVTAALRRPALRRLVGGYFAYCLARKASRVALVVAAFEAAGVSGAALVAAVQLLPAVVAAPLAPALTDRVSPARALTLGYLTQALGLAATGAALVLDASLGVVTVLAGVAAAAFTVTRPVYLASLPDAVRTPEEVAAGNALSAWVDGVASVAGPLLAAAALATVGGGWVLVLLGAVAAVAAAGSAGVRTPAVAGEATGLASAVRAGLGAVRGDGSTATLLGLVCLQYAVVGLLDVLLVVTTVELLARPASASGVLTAALGVGATVGGLASTVLAGRRRLSPALLAGACLGGLPLGLVAVASATWPVAGLVALLGVGKSLLTVAAQTLLQRTVEPAVAARVFGVQEGLVQAGTAAGSALGPLLVVVAGPRGALAATAVLLPVATLAGAAALRRLDRRAVVPGATFALLRHVPFLALLPLRLLERLARATDEREVPAGAAVVREGEPGDEYYVVASGQVEVFAAGAAARTLGPGEGFGEIALLHAVPRTATVVATTDVRLVALQRSDFLAALTGVEPAAAAAAVTAREYLEDDGRRSGDG